MVKNVKTKAMLFLQIFFLLTHIIRACVNKQKLYYVKGTEKIVRQKQKLYNG